MTSLGLGTLVKEKLKCYIIAGPRPNGAGKTTFAGKFLPVEAECLNFINADLIAKGIAYFNPERVAQGGRNVPVDVIKRRFHRGWKNIFEVHPLIRYLCGNARIGIPAQIATYQNIFNFFNLPIWQKKELGYH